MNAQTKYSDEHINAYIDDELDSEERARLIFDEQNDAELAVRINSARMLKEKVHLAYADIGQEYSRNQTYSDTTDSGLLTPMRAAAAVMVMLGAFLVTTLTGGPSDGDLSRASSLIASTDATPSQLIVASAATGDNIVIDLNRYDPAVFDETIANIEKLARGTSATVEVVANGQGLQAVETDSKHATVLAGLADQLDNLDVMVCAATLAATESERTVNLLGNIVTTTSVVHQVASRTADGWSYLKLQ